MKIHIETLTGSTGQMDLRAVPAPVRNALVRRAWEQLPPGKQLILIHDQDPVALRYLFAVEFPGVYGWEFQEHGPRDFCVKITRQAEAA